MVAFNYNLLLLYTVLFISGFIIVNVMTKNFVLEWWRVKRSNGRKIMVRVRNASGFYHKAGEINNGFLHYIANKRKDNPTPQRMISLVITNAEGQNIDITHRVIYNSLSINWIDVDDVKNCILFVDSDSYIACPGFNAELVDEAINTALAKPSDVNTLFSEKAFQIIVVCGFLLLIAGMVFLYQTLGKNDAHVKMVYDMVKPMYDTMFNSTISTIPIGG